MLLLFLGVFVIGALIANYGGGTSAGYLYPERTG